MVGTHSTLAAKRGFGQLVSAAEESSEQRSSDRTSPQQALLSRSWSSRPTDAIRESA